MQNLIRFFLSRSVLLNLLFILMMVTGAFALLTSPVDRYPYVNMGKVVINSFYPGASPEEVEALVTNKIEDALDDLKNVEFVRATSYRQRSSVVVKFVDDSDYQKGYDELRFKVLSVVDELPDEVDPPSFTLIDVDAWLPVVSVDLSGQRSNRALSLIAKEMKIALRQIPGVKEVKLEGERTREFHVFVDPAKLSRLGVTFDQVGDALRAANISVPAGEFDSKGGEFVIKADERFRSLQQVMATVIRADADGSYLRVADVAGGAGLGYRDPVLLSSVNGQDSVSLSLVKASWGNVLQIFKDAQAVVARFRPVLDKEGVTVTYTQNNTTKVIDSIRTLGWNLGVGVVMVCLVIWYVMGLRNAVITTIGIPFSFLFTMVFMKITGNSLNEITLFSFVLVSGIVVDDAIIVVENIYRHVQQGESVTEAIVKGAAEVFMPVVSATLTTVAAFLPMLIMTGSVGEFFALIPKAISFALLASLIECLVMLPLHYRDIGPRKGKGRILIEDENFENEGLLMRLVRGGSIKCLKGALKAPWLALFLTFLLFLASLIVMGLSLSGKSQLIKIKFFPDDYSIYYAQLTCPAGTPIEETHKLVKEVARFIMADGPGLAESAKGYAGFYVDEDYEPVWGYNLGNVVVTLPSKGQRAFDDAPALLQDMRERLRVFEKNGVSIKVRPEKDGPPAGKDLNIRVVGSNPASVDKLSRAVTRFISDDPRLKGQVVDVDDGRGQPSRVIQFRVRPEKAAEFGITPSRVVQLSAAVLNGSYVGKYRLVDEDVDCKLKLDPKAMQGPVAALNLPLVEHPSGPVRLGDLASLDTYVDSGDLKRYQGERAITISANLISGSKVSVPRVVELVRRYYETVQTQYPGATLGFGGEFESTRKSYESLAFAFVIAIGLIYLILASQFQSYIQPLIILTAVGFALIGVVVGKLVSQSLFTINSFIAVVGVAGVVVNDALVLIDFLNRRYVQLKDRRTALFQAVHIRLRPILLTTLTTTLGLLPMAVGVPEYSVVWGTMATTFVTGLCTSSLLSIVLVPVQWDILVRRREKRIRKKAARAALEENGI